jgi:phytoene synthase
MSLADAYRVCRDVHKEHGRSYFLATRLLPRWKRRHVHALYAFTRCTDDIVDSLEPDGSYDADVQQRRRRLDEWGERFRSGLRGGASPQDPVLQAVLHTIAVFDLDPTDFESFLTSMAMDLTVTEYADYDALLTYMEGSAAVIGTMMLPILLADELPAPTLQQTLLAAREPARQLGLAFQLTNFVRDVREDATRGRVYLPRADLDLFGVSRTDLVRETAGADVRDLVELEVARARRHYLAAQGGLESLPPRSRRCIRLATAVYGGILTEVEAAGYDVLAGRVRVPYRRRAAMTAQELLHR